MAWSADYALAMDVGVLKSELQALESKDRRQMIAFLLALEERANLAYRQELARRIDDKEGSHPLDNA